MYALVHLIRAAALLTVLLASRAQGEKIIRNFTESLLLSAHTDMVEDVALNPANEAVFLSRGEDSQVILWDWTTREQLWKTTTSKKRGVVAFSHQGNVFAYSDDETLVLMSTASRTVLHSLKPKTSEGAWLASPECVTFSQDDALIAVGYSSRIIVWETASGNFVGDYRAWGNLMGCNDVTFSIDGTRLQAMDSHSFYFWNISETSADPRWGTPPKKEVRFLQHGEGNSRVSAISPDAQYGAFATFEKAGKLFVTDLASGLLIQTIRISTENIESIRFSIDGCCLLAGSRDGTTRIFEVSTRAEISRLDDTRSSFERSSFRALAEASRTGVVISGDQRGEIRIWKTH